MDNICCESAAHRVVSRAFKHWSEICAQDNKYLISMTDVSEWFALKAGYIAA